MVTTLLPPASNLDTFRDNILVEIGRVMWADEGAMGVLCEELGVTILLLDLQDGVQVTYYGFINSVNCLERQLQHRLE